MARVTDRIDFVSRLVTHVFCSASANRRLTGRRAFTIKGISKRYRRSRVALHRELRHALREFENRSADRPGNRLSFPARSTSLAAWPARLLLRPDRLGHRRVDRIDCYRQAVL